MIRRLVSRRLFSAGHEAEQKAVVDLNRQTADHIEETDFFHKQKPYRDLLDLPTAYRAQNHSLLPHLFMYRFLNDNIGYILQEPKKKELILIDAGDF